MHCFVQSCALSRHQESFYNTFILILLRPSLTIAQGRIVSRAHKLQPQLGRGGTHSIHASNLWQHSIYGVDKTVNRARLRPKSVTGALIRLARGFLRPRAVRAESGIAQGTCGLVPSVEIYRPHACSRLTSAWNRTARSAQQPVRGYLPETRQSDTDRVLRICCT
jgi:hypothetical protein